MRTMVDLLHPDVKAIVEEIDLPEEDKLRIIQRSLPAYAKAMIDNIHLLLCHSNDCTYHDEELLEDTWANPEHLQYIDRTLDLLNACNIDEKDWEKHFFKYLHVIREIGGPGPVHDLVKYLYYKQPLPSNK